MAEYRRAEVISGGFILASVLVFALFAFKVIGIPLPWFEESGVVCEALFHDVKQLDSAAKVTVGGLRVGTVISVRPEGKEFEDSEITAEVTRNRVVPAGWDRGRERTMIRVRFRITDPDLRIGEGASAAIAQEGFIGPFYVDLDPGTWSASARPRRAVERKGEVIAFATRRVDSFHDLLPMVTPILEQLEGIATRINQGLLEPLLDGREQDIRSIVPNLTQSMADVQAGIADFRAMMDPAGEQSVAKKLNEVLTSANRTIEGLDKEIKENIAPRLAAALDEGKATLKTAQDAMADLRKLVTEADPKLQTILTNLAEETGRLDARLTDLQGKLGKVLVDIDHLATMKQADVAALMQSLLNSAFELEMTLRKVRANPAVILFGDDEKRLEAEPRDDTGLRNRGRARPYDQRDESPTRK